MKKFVALRCGGTDQDGCEAGSSMYSGIKAGAV
jgi:hypothetical protein